MSPQTSPPRVVATDLDGTLLRSDGHVSSRTRAALERAEAAGATVILVTGRPPRWMRQVARETGAHGLAVLANGGLVYDLGADRVVRKHPITPEVATRLVRDLRDELPEIVFAVERGETFGHEPGYVPLYPSDAALVDEVERLVAEPLTKLLAKVPGRHPRELFDVAARIAGADAVVTWSGDVVLEIGGAGVTKALALESLCADLDVAPEDVVAFGDMPNDVPLLTWAGHAVAVANAHPDVLAVADEVTASNDDDGVALVLERLYPEA